MRRHALVRGGDIIEAFLELPQRMSSQALTDYIQIKDYHTWISIPSPTNSRNLLLEYLLCHGAGIFVSNSPVCPFKIGKESPSDGSFLGSTEALCNLLLMAWGRHSESGDWAQ